MDVKKIGRFISDMRREKSLTQAQLAEKIGVTDKAVSKWECGKCLPDISLNESLCETLDITMNELIKGERIEPLKVQKAANENVIDLLKDIQKLRRNKLLISALCSLIISFLLLLYYNLWQPDSGSMYQFISGMLFGLSIGCLFLGIGSIFVAWVKYIDKK